MNALVTRLRQGFTALLRQRQPLPFPARWSGDVPQEIRALWKRLPPYDQHHLVEVAEELDAAGAGRPTVLAGLLHDIGKTGRVSLPARVAAVLLNRFLPAVAERVRRTEPPSRGMHGLHLVLTHAERGARLLEARGVEARVVWLVRHHEEHLPDDALATLRAADNRHSANTPLRETR